MRYILIQPVSQIGDEPGRFRNTFTGEEVETLDVVPIKVQKRRVLNPLEYGKPSLCASHDGLYSLAAFGDGTPTAYPLRECQTCPQFSDSEWGKNQELCAPEYLVWAYRPAAHEVVEINLRRSSYKIGGFLALPHILGRSVIRLIAGEVMGRQGRYYQILPRPQGLLNEEEQEFIRELTELMDVSDANLPAAV